MCTFDRPGGMNGPILRMYKVRGKETQSWFRLEIRNDVKYCEQPPLTSTSSPRIVITCTHEAA